MWEGCKLSQPPDNKWKTEQAENQQLFWDASKKWGHKANRCPQTWRQDRRIQRITTFQSRNLCGKQLGEGNENCDGQLMEAQCGWDWEIKNSRRGQISLWDSDVSSFAQNTWKWGLLTSIPSFIGAAPICIPINSAQGFLYPSHPHHILANPCYFLFFDNSHPNKCDVISPCDFDLWRFQRCILLSYW